MKNDLIYLATPYSDYKDGREKAFQLACKKASEMMLDGYKVFCPIAHSHPIEEHGNMKRQTGDWWLAQDFAVLSHCKELWVYCMPGYEDSYGVQKEIDFAVEHKIPIRYVV